MASTIAKLIASIANAVMCNWYPFNAVIRYEMGLNGNVTDYKTLYTAKGTQEITAMKLATYFSGTQKPVNGVGSTDKYPVLLCAAVIKHKAGEPRGTFDLRTYEEYPADTKSRLAFTDRVQPIWLRIVRLYGYQDRLAWNSGFKNSTFPGPIAIENEDALELALYATDNYNSPNNTNSQSKGFITGTLSWQFNVEKPSVATDDIT